VYYISEFLVEFGDDCIDGQFSFSIIHTLLNCEELLVSCKISI